MKWKEDGNKFFKKNDLAAALSAYKYALDGLEKRVVKDNTPEIKKLMVSLYQNTAMCSESMNMRSATIQMSSLAI
jgi:hypothetical protein